MATTPSLPKTLLIDGITWKVTEVDEHAFDDFATCGDQCSITQEIRINNSMTQEMKEKVLFHEIGHCLNGEKEHEEIELEGNAWYRTLKTNNLLNFF